MSLKGIRNRNLLWLIAIGSGYVVTMTVLLICEDAFIFRPKTAEQSWFTPTDSMRVEDIYLHTKNGNRIHGWWSSVGKNCGAVLICHPQNANISVHLREQDLLQWKELQLSVFIFDYPGFGNSTGAPSESECYEAGEMAYNWLIDNQKIPAKDIVLYGRSLGSAVAVDLASRHEHRALILVGSFTSIPDVACNSFPIWPWHFLMHNEFAAIDKIGLCHRPILMFHGKNDARTPFHLALKQASCCLR